MKHQVSCEHKAQTKTAQESNSYKNVFFHLFMFSFTYLTNTCGAPLVCRYTALVLHYILQGYLLKADE